MQAKIMFILKVKSQILFMYTEEENKIVMLVSLQ